MRRYIYNTYIYILYIQRVGLSLVGGGCRLRLDTRFRGGASLPQISLSGTVCARRIDEIDDTRRPHPCAKFSDGLILVAGCHHDVTR